ncbi:thiopeptide-type bacteriocin biosynthesis protein [Ancylomarina subtilis]|uniref:Thiopeptide-type bacteriocin biosynthesis protein n=1 Tax=Ancylomarina subtilis TaxID=1639035 RepID=A0A4Q7VMX4_9BACT|nr:thiopeptide-type bacteriocin biosynthesis protein [Ancylomarina subtilis]RZT97554.1 thiopeptide-type bacteriocin biosynthesis protein [Ancylomarina subtilis]
MKNVISRSYLPGDQWLYYKIYCGVKTADDILINEIYSLCKQLEAQGLIERFFFIRYSDPHAHIRLRLFLSNQDALLDTMSSMNEIFAPLVQSDVIHKLQLDTYERELERYAIESIEISEKLFCAESRLILQFMRNNENYEERLFFVIALIDNYLTLFEFDFNTKKAFFQKLKDAFGSEFNINNPLKRQIESKYRNYRNIIDQYLFADKSASITNLLSLDNHVIKKYISEILEIQSGNKYTIESIIQSHVHMLMNRVFRADQRLYELLVYDFMWRAYKSRIARMTYSKIN